MLANASGAAVAMGVPPHRDAHRDISVAIDDEPQPADNTEVAIAGPSGIASYGDVDSL